MSGHRLPDILDYDLDVIFVGTAAGKRAAKLGHYYAGPGNRFWPTLFEVGLTASSLRSFASSSICALDLRTYRSSALGWTTK